MSRLIRGLWYCEALMPDGSALTTQPVGYDQVAVEIGLLGASRAILRRVPRSRARWEFLAPYEASDPPVWGEDTEEETEIAA
jgi:hypothetical protein